MTVTPDLALSPFTLFLLFLAGGLAGLIDAIAGGGGLITVPVLLGVGLPPQFALGTNKLQSTFGSASAMAHFVRAGTVRLRPALAGILWTAVGACLGAWAVQQIDPSFLKRLIPYLLLGILCYTVFTPKLGMEEVHPRLSHGVFYALFGLLLGFYDGFLGPGTGSFWVVAIMLCLGYDMRKATGHTKLFNFVSNIVSLVVFLVGGHVVFVAGLVMGAGQAIGARLGAKLVIKKGARFIRPVFICSVLAVTIKLFFN
ncbi:TSUP family transporter [Geomesophilobacter sediminis]|uniref:Probable membrane transporter protein n=1 Tax=Geomesophilobacter sediminis TaxID=2798584 RepID=A0A8J7LXJ3_9BACT|nr:TSUP family transporter [Geomesophilobacter sediminis]MBJ6723262.1 TSUP family transporter [Geomesophilobacter sediminis]